MLSSLVFTCKGYGQDRVRNTAADFVRKYCIDCHDKTDPAGEREFESLNLESDHWDTQLRLQEIIDQLNLGTMPPEDAAQPDVNEKLASIENFTALLLRMRDRSNSTGGHTVLRRLNRREYRNTIRDLLGIDMTMFDPTIEFPADNLSDHFDNVGDTLVTSGYLLEKYLDAAHLCVEKAFAPPPPDKPQEWVFDGPFKQQNELDAAHRFAFDSKYMVLYDHPWNDKPEGAYGPLSQFPKGVPLDGIYEVKVLAQALHRDTLYTKQCVQIDLAEPFRLGIRPGNTALGDMVHVQPIQPLLAEVAVHDNELEWYTFRIPLDKGYAPRFTFENGMHDVRNAYGRVFRFQPETLPPHARDHKGIVEFRKNVIKFGYLPQIRIHEVRLRGPLTRAQSDNGPFLRFANLPLNPEDVPELLKQFASRAYRHPVSDDELASLIGIFRDRLAAGRDPMVAFKDAIKASLCSPSFLYMHPPKNADRGLLSNHQLAERLSYFITSTLPDESLKKLADAGQLSDDDVLQSETRRLLQSDASHAFVSDFLDSWLNLRALGSMPPDEKESRVYYADGLESDMKQETRMFFRDLIDRNASVLELLRADYTFANRDLAQLYGVADQVPPEEAERFRRIQFQTRDRGGLLGQASILTVSANGIETSPVIRGIWLMETILGTPVPPPPDSVPALDPDVRGAVSIRDQLAKHRESASCNSCHRKFDPLGFALEGFDPIGRKREFYDGKQKIKIDTSGELPGGDRFSGPEELREALLRREDFFVRTVVSRLFTHALGRRMEATDRGAIDKLVMKLKTKDYPLVDLIVAVVQSDHFRRW
jgi:hypothetical protein